jgi:hypothetical protein
MTLLSDASSMFCSSIFFSHFLINEEKKHINKTRISYKVLTTAYKSRQEMLAIYTFWGRRVVVFSSVLSDILCCELPMFLQVLLC